MKIIIIVARDKNGVIGYKNEIPWHLPADLKQFKSRTINHAVLMGRRTYESIGKALPKRRNYVLSSNSYLHLPGCDVFSSLEDAISLASSEFMEKLFIIGGSRVYKYAIPFADEMYITEVNTHALGDVFFPFFQEEFWNKEQVCFIEKDVDNDHSAGIFHYVRR